MATTDPMSIFVNSASCIQILISFQVGLYFGPSKMFDFSTFLMEKYWKYLFLATLILTRIEHFCGNEHTRLDLDQGSSK